MRKLSFILAITFILSLALVGPATSENLYWHGGTEPTTDKTFGTGNFWYGSTAIDPKDAFSKEFSKATFIYKGQEWQDASYVVKQSNVFRLYRLSDRPEEYELWVDSDTMVLDVNHFITSMIRLPYATPSLWDYPFDDIISINGEPWQNTEYAKLIIEEVRKDLPPRAIIYDVDGDPWHWFVDPRTNGAGQIMFDKDWFKDNKVQLPGTHKNIGFGDHIWLDHISKYNPVNDGEPLDPNKWFENYYVTKEDFRDEAVLELGNPLVTIVRDGATKRKVLSVAPESTGGRTLIPLRGVLNEFGYELNYNSEKQAVEISGHQGTIILFIEKRIAIVNGKEVG